MDVSLEGAWYLDKTNQRDLRRFLKQQEIFALNPREENGRLILTLAWGDFAPHESLNKNPSVMKLGKGTILVLNGTSATGLACLTELRNFTHLYNIRASSRRAPTEKLLSSLPHVQWVTSDLSKDSLFQVTRGVNKVFYVMPLVQERVQIAKDLAKALTANCVSYLVHISIIGAQFRPGLFGNQSKDCEEAFEAAHVPVTHLRCSGFFENLLNNAQSIKVRACALSFFVPFAFLILFCVGSQHLLSILGSRRRWMCCSSRYWPRCLQMSRSHWC